MARKMPHGQRYRYKLRDGSSWTVLEAMDKMVELWKEPVSESLMQQRLSHSKDPDYVFLKKRSAWTKDGGHVYSQKNQARKLAKLKNKAKPRPKKTKKLLTADEEEAAIALKRLGIAWT